MHLSRKCFILDHLVFAVMGHEGDTKSFVGHDHGQKLEGQDGSVPTSEKQWRDMPKGARPKVKPSEQHEEPAKETQVATGKGVIRLSVSCPQCMSTETTIAYMALRQVSTSLGILQRTRVSFQKTTQSTERISQKVRKGLLHPKAGQRLATTRSWLVSLEEEKRRFRTLGLRN